MTTETPSQPSQEPAGAAEGAGPAQSAARTCLECQSTIVEQPDDGRPVDPTVYQLWEKVFNLTPDALFAGMNVVEAEDQVDEEADWCNRGCFFRWLRVAVHDQRDRPDNTGLES